MSTDNEEYDGPSKIGNAYAKSMALSPVAWTGAAVGGVATFAKTVKNTDAIVETHLDEIRLGLKGLKRGALVGIGVLGATSALGAIWGWNQAEKSQASFSALKQERDALRSENSHLKGTMESIRQATNATFAERQQPRAGGYAEAIASEPSSGRGHGV